MAIYDYSPPPEIDEIGYPDSTPPIIPWITHTQIAAPLEQFQRPAADGARAVSIWVRQNRDVLLVSGALVLVMIIDKVTK